MDLYMETKLDGLYYRTPATPGSCGPYKNVTTYNKCSFEQAHNTQAYSRSDYILKRPTLEKYEDVKVEDAKVKMLINGPQLFDYIVGKSDNEKINFIKKNFNNKELIETLGKYYPQIVKKALSESYGVY
jgi:hypothetical protein